MLFMWPNTRKKPGRKDFCEANDHGGAVHRALHAIMHLIEDHAARADIPVRFAASKLAEGDALILEQLALDENRERDARAYRLSDGDGARPGPRGGDCGYAF